MAGRSEEIFIILKAIGAAATARDIQKVNRALESLNDRTEKNTKQNEANSKSLEGNAESRKKQDESIRKSSTSLLNFNKRMDRLNSLARANNGLLNQNIRGLQRQRKALDAVNAGYAKQNKATGGGYIKSIRNQERAVKDLGKAQHKTFIDAVKNEKKLTRQLKVSAAGHTRVVWAEEDRKSRILDRQRGIETDKIRKWYASLEKDHLAHGARDRVITTQNAKSAARISQEYKNSRFQAPELHHAGRIAMYSSMIFGALDILPFVATGLNALAAGGIAVVNGLAPLRGLFIAIPAGMMALVQGGIVAKMIFGGLGDAIKGDAKALEALGPNTRKFVDEIIEMKPVLNGLRRSVQETFFKGLTPELTAMAEILLPTINKELNRTADFMNTAFRNFTGWATSDDGADTIEAAMKANAVFFGLAADAAQVWLQTWIASTAAAGPMMELMGTDFLEWSHSVNAAAGKDGLSDFFVNSYKHLKKVMSVLGNFGRGLIQIFRLSQPLTDALGDSVTGMSEDFERWTKSKDGIRDIKQYFADMKGPLYAVGSLFGAIALAIFDIARSPNFEKTIKLLTDEFLPAATSLILNSDGKFLDSFVRAFDAIVKVADSGGMDGVAAAASWFATSIERIADAVALLPPEVVKNGVMALIIGGFAGKGIAGAANLMTGKGKFPNVKAFKSLLGVGGVGAAGKGGVAGALGLGAAGAGPLIVAAALIAALAASFVILYQNSETFRESLTNIGNYLSTTWNTTVGPQFATTIGNIDQAWKDLGGTMKESPNTMKALEFIWTTSLTTLAAVAGSVAGGVVISLKMIELAITAVFDAMGVVIRGIESFFQAIDSIRNYDSSVNHDAPNGLTHQQQQDANDRQFNNPYNMVPGQAWGATPRFAGGMTSPGGLYMTGELGPELTIDRSGNFGMLGLNGPEFFSPSLSTAIIPASATSDPFGGSYGNAPDWAKRTLQGAMGSSAGSAARMPIPTNRERSEGSGGNINVDVTVINPTQDVNVTKAVTKAMEKVERDRRERKYR